MLVLLSAKMLHTVLGADRLKWAGFVREPSDLYRSGGFPSAANVRLSSSIRTGVASVAALDHARLCQKLAELLGPTVIQGAGDRRQATKAEVRVVKHHHRLDAVARAVARIEPARIVEAAPHLTDAEVVTLAARAAARLPAAEADQAGYLRSQALALVNEYRLVGCRVDARCRTASRPRSKVSSTSPTATSFWIHPTSDSPATGPGPAAGGGGRNGTWCWLHRSGHTLTGPVLDVAEAWCPSWAALLARWQAG